MELLQNQQDLDHSLGRLVALDPVLERYLEGCGAVAIRQREGDLNGLLQIILAQQVSVASARSIWERFEARFPGCDMHALSEAGSEDLQACGLSRPKIKTVHAIVQALNEGFDLVGLTQLDTADARAQLVGLHGVGPWTADIYLLFCLGRADIFPAGDLALQVAVQTVYNRSERPKEKWLADFAENKWAPERSAAAHLFWAIYKHIKEGRDGVLA